MIIYQLDVFKEVFTEKQNWLKVNNVIDPYDYLDEDKRDVYTIYFSDFDSMSNYIDDITKGFSQYYADIYERTDGAEESLEYHNGGEWDEEIHLTTKKVRIHQSLIDVVKSL